MKKNQTTPAALCALCAAILTISCDDRAAGLVPDIDIQALLEAAEGAGAHAPVDEGTPFAPKTLGLSPGATNAEMRFNWYAAQGVTKSWVRLFRGGSLVSVTAGTSGAVRAKTTNTCSSYDCTNPEMSWHKAAVTGLTPGSSYEYSVSNDSVNWSHRYTFETPHSGPFSFAFVTDPQVTRGDQDCSSWGGGYCSSPPTCAKGWEETVAKIAGLKIPLIVGGGDQVDHYGSGSNFSADEGEYDIFFAPPALRSIPYAAVMGNHDMHDPFAYHFNPPNLPRYSCYPQQPVCYDMSTMGAHSYYYLYNNVLFVALNTGIYVQESAAANRVKAMDDLIKKAKAEHSGKFDWLIVHHHRSTYSQGSQMGAPETGYLVAAGLNKIMIQNGVHLVLTGHDHTYSRSHVVTIADTTNPGKLDLTATSPAATAPTSGSSAGKISMSAAGERTVTLANGGTLFIGGTSASGGKYYPLGYSAEANPNYPFFRDGTRGVATANANHGKPTWAANAYEQRRSPEYIIFDVISSREIRMRTYKVNDANPVDEVTITNGSPVSSVLAIPRGLGL
ncbi:MAG: metallophosphoesterase [Chitinispirillia bacterium]|nr:metallophosphoesterase [Chitinispirillia bacterium]MCL2242512.1 metallophosphoesterase [Chitinispirillia bacterium]